MHNYHSLVPSHEKRKFRIVLKNCSCILRKPNFGQKMRILKQSPSAKKIKRSDPLGILKLQFVAKHQGETPWRQKSLTAQKKLKVGWGAFRLVRFCMLRLKSKNQRGDPLQ